MRCKQCDYPLWNLKARQCPECGVAFVPADYEFVINSVRFCCPHCDQPYYGIGDKGHLVPTEFNCVKCAHPVAMNQMVLRPAEGVEERQTQADHMPWLMRQQIGWWLGWIRTIGYSMVRPHLLMRATPLETSVGQAWWYATVTCLLVFFCGIGLPLMGIGVIMIAQGDRDAFGAFIAGPITTVCFTGLFLLGALVWGLVAHGLLKISGGASHSLGRTYSAILYSIGANAPLALPAIGPYCGLWVMWIWWSVSAIFMVSEGQKVHGGRAAFAVLAFPIILILLLSSGYVVAFYALMNMVGTRTQMANASPAVGETSAIVQAIVQHAVLHNGQGPRHALELVQDQTFGVSNFKAADSLTDVENISVGETSLDELEYLPPNKLALTIADEADALPDDVVAHRLGDFVFTYHGVDLSAPNPQLWIVMYSPDPDSNTGPGPSRPIVGFADGTARALPGRMANELRAQNALRAQFSLPPLPDPATVTHRKPARARNAGNGSAAPSARSDESGDEEN